MLILASQSSPSPSPRICTFPALSSPNFRFFPVSNSIPPSISPVSVTPIKENQSLSPNSTSRLLQIRDLGKFENCAGGTISGFNNLLTSLVSAEEFELALKLKDGLSSSELFPDNWTYSILVDCYCKKNEPTEAKTVLDQMLEKGFAPSVATCTTLINAFCKTGRLRDAYKVFDLMSKVGCEPTINTYNCLLKGLCYLGRVEEAYDLMQSIKKSSSVKPDIYTYTTVMDGFCKVGRSTEASELLHEALEMELTPNVVTYNTLFNSYFKEGKPLRGFDVLRRMRERHCKPDYICYSTLLHGLLKWGKIRAALRIYKEMIETGGYRVDERMMNTLLRGLCRRSREEKELLKEAYSVYEEMVNRKYRMCHSTYDLVVEAFCCGGGKTNSCRVSEIIEEMVRMGHSPKTFTFNIAIHALCSAGEVDKALGVLMLMHRNRKPNGIPFDLLLDVLNQQQRSLEASAVYGVALKRGVMPNRKPSS